MIIPAVREDMRGTWYHGSNGKATSPKDGEMQIRILLIPPTTNNNMDFGNDIPDYDPDDFDNYDYE